MTLVVKQPVRLKDVAAAAGVHISTASRALDPATSWRISEATVTRVRELSNALGYTPDMVARGLKRGTSNTIGIVVATLQDPFIALVVRGVTESLEEGGVVAFVGETQDDHGRLERLVETLIGRRVDAIVTTAACDGDGPLLRLAVDRGAPVVLAVRTLAGASFPAVVADDARGVELAVGHLAELGHRVCAQLRGPAGVSSFAVRAGAFERSLAARGLVDVSSGEWATPATIEEGRRLMAATLAQPKRPTAVFAHTDLLAVGAVEAIRAAGLECPGDVSVVGFNDVPLAGYLSPPLTTVRIPALELGRCAADLATRSIDNHRRRPTRRTFAPEFVIRGSTGPVPKGVRR